MGRRQHHLGLDPVAQAQASGDVRAQAFAGVRIGGATLDHGHHCLLALARHREHRHVAAAQGRSLGLGGPFQVLGPYVAAVDDDQVLGAPGEHDLPAREIAEVARVEPTVLRYDPAGLLGLAEIGAHQAGPAREDAADLALGQRLTAFAADRQLVARQRRPAEGEFARAGRAVRGRNRGLVALQPVDIQHVGAQALVQGREAEGQGRLGHAVAGHEGARVESRGREALGEGAQHLRADHVAPDSGGAPGAEVEALDVHGLGPAGAQLVAEGGAVRDGAPMA